MLPEPTRRLRFRQMRESDLDHVTETLSASDPHRPDHQPRERADAERWIAWNSTNYREHGFGLWVIETHDGQFVGDCGLSEERTAFKAGGDVAIFGVDLRD